MTKKAKQSKKVDVEVLVCGHPRTVLIWTDEGTHYCRWCLYEANSRIREKLLKQAYKLLLGAPPIPRPDPLKGKWTNDRDKWMKEYNSTEK